MHAKVLIPTGVFLLLILIMLSQQKDIILEVADVACYGDSFINNNGEFDFGFQCDVKASNPSNSRVSEVINAKLHYQDSNGQEVISHDKKVTLNPKETKDISFFFLEPTIGIDINTVKVFFN